MYPTMLNDIILLVGLSLFLVFLIIGYSKFKLGLNCEKKLLRYFIIFIILEMIWILGQAYRIFYIFTHANEDVSNFSEILRYINIHYFIEIAVNLVHFISFAYLIYKIDRILFYKYTKGKIGISILILVLVVLVFSMIIFPIYWLVVFIYTIFVILNLLRSGKIAPKTRIYTWFISLGLFLYSIAYLFFSLLYIKYSWPLLSEAFFFYNNPGLSVFSSLRFMISVIYVLGIFILGYGIIKTSHLPYLNAKNRSIYGATRQTMVEPAITKKVPNYQFGSPNLGQLVLDQANNRKKLTQKDKDIQNSFNLSKKVCPYCNNPILNKEEICPSCGASFDT
ncbi:hypothetical protein [Candidatus Lokiarchaeum ossiferum]|uniref:hypothetical protein n=1 Tax=Candidatus Lokiarchaeum ossiferum TaxID=2951803 RepID=UPI00352D86E9